MSTILQIERLAQTTIPHQRNVGVLKQGWRAFQEWRELEKLRLDLCKLSDQELMDIGITYGEIDYVVSNRNTDPRGILSAERCRL
ncbi:DUF1127 domain-containing protein [Bradyrhizobium sp. CCGE-LA001]|uniref:DUF1127 domain-containing protein n=1 Tax=Bradyrhizobium sp. CCGE-LA001 TaxID=1223566 RepID=UPI0002AA672D|nr:DUF1127 domain-containing protein [Bradyrhizobium sp. CCGE-LA001]AMA59436.1 hypothetical protein BCCGELA001_26315 [Bradyrhizobium sp. CCGE-LA001]